MRGEIKATNVITIVSLVTAIAGGAYFLDDRYAHADAFTEQVMYSANYHLEQEIARAQDKLDGLLAIPSDERRPWQDREIVRLENIIKRLIRSRGDGPEARIGG